MASDGDTFARLSELTRQNYEFADQATRILKGFEVNLRASNPGFEFLLDDVVYETAPAPVDHNRTKWLKLVYRLAWTKMAPIGWSLVAVVDNYGLDGSLDDDRGVDEPPWYPTHDPRQSFMIDSWPAPVRVAALNRLEKFSQQLLAQVESQVADREETARLINEYSHFADAIGDREGDK